LQTIKFDLQVEHPYSYLLKYAKCLKGNMIRLYIKQKFMQKEIIFISNKFILIFVGDKNKLQKMVQMAWTFVNDR
jgi:hypothetical protein